LVDIRRQELGGAGVGKVGQNVGSNTRERDWKEKRQSDRNLGEKGEVAFRKE